MPRRVALVTNLADVLRSKTSRRGTDEVTWLWAGRHCHNEGFSMRKPSRLVDLEDDGDDRDVDVDLFDVQLSASSSPSTTSFFVTAECSKSRR